MPDENTGKKRARQGLSGSQAGGGHSLPELRLGAERLSASRWYTDCQPRTGQRTRLCSAPNRNLLCASCQHSEPFSGAVTDISTAGGAEAAGRPQLIRRETYNIPG
ncbi:hypothetical protein WJX77_000792 [Trebouxia sp. C0004]